MTKRKGVPVAGDAVQCSDPENRPVINDIELHTASLHQSGAAVANSCEKSKVYPRVRVRARAFTPPEVLSTSSGVCVGGREASSSAGCAVTDGAGGSPGGSPLPLSPQPLSADARSERKQGDAASGERATDALADAPPGRIVDRWDLRREIARGLERRKTRLARSMAHIGERPLRAGDVARLAQLRADVDQFAELLERIDNGQPVPASPLTGRWTGALPDKLGEPDAEER